MGIKISRKNRFIVVLFLVIIVLSFSIIDIDRNIQFSCTSINEGSEITFKCFVEPFDARVITEEIEISLNRRFDFLTKKVYLAKIYKIDNVISYHNGIAYRAIYCEVPEGTFDEGGIILDGVVKIEKISTFKLILISILNWLEPYSGEKIKLN